MFSSHINESLLIIKAITEIILIADILEDESEFSHASGRSFVARKETYSNFPPTIDFPRFSTFPNRKNFPEQQLSTNYVERKPEKLGGNPRLL